MLWWWWRMCPKWTRNGLPIHSTVRNAKNMTSNVMKLVILCIEIQGLSKYHTVQFQDNFLDVCFRSRGRDWWLISSLSPMPCLIFNVNLISRPLWQKSLQETLKRWWPLNRHRILNIRDHRLKRIDSFRLWNLFSLGFPASFKDKIA